MQKQHRSQSGPEKGDTTPLITKIGPLESNLDRQAAVRATTHEGDHIVGDNDLLLAMASDVGEQKAADQPEDKAMRSASVSVGQWGSVQPKGAMEDLPVEEGTPVKITKVEGDSLTVETQDGEESFTLQVGDFSPKPELAADEKTGEHDELQWTEFDPVKMDSFTVDDVAQGYIGDCYLIAAMGSVVAGNSKFVEESMRYDASTGMYQVRFFEEIGPDEDGNAQYEPVWIEVDGYLPTKDGSLHYATAAEGATSWAPFMEKAYAVWKGGYEAIGHGASTSSAMEGLTGVETEYKNTGDFTEEEILQYLRDTQTGGFAMTMGTPDTSNKDEDGMFTGKDGKVKGVLNGDTEITPETVTMKASNEKDSFESRDKDGEVKGELGNGTIDYDKGGDIRLTLSLDALDVDVEKMGATWEEHYRDTKFNLYGNHAYIFNGVNDANEIMLKNPWGVEHPNAIPVSDFLEIFTYLDRLKIPGAS